MDNVIMTIAKSIEQKEDISGNRVLHEAIQQVALAGLYRSGFFGKAAFYGGTCLRIFHGLDRFSEDLDFSLLVADEKFDLSVYFNVVRSEFAAYGCDVDFEKKRKTALTNVQSAFLKSNTETWDLTPGIQGNIKIKVEVDTIPPTGFSTEPKMLLLPFTFHTPCFILPDLFAGKMHALLFRKWKTRVKGRDWYDFEWYIRHQVPLNINHFNMRMLQSEDSSKPFSESEIIDALEERIRMLDIDQARTEVTPFIRNPNVLETWSKEYFLEIAKMIRFSGAAELLNHLADLRFRMD
jgi:predicted nucleotidyltransferase component of viral defense system